MTAIKLLLIVAFISLYNFTSSGCYHKPTITFEPMEISRISKYDAIMKEEAARNDIDWRFLAAIGFQESRFNNDAVSPVGALGVMQIMPHVAEKFGVSRDSVLAPQVNIATATKLLKSIEKSMKFPKSIDKEERMRIILGCYNAGIGNILDAHRLAARYGANSYKWDDLKVYMKLKVTPDFINDKDVKCGSFNHRETIHFVDIVMDKYKKYCNKYPA